MSNRLEYDIKEKYGYELNEISNKLNQLEAEENEIRRQQTNGAQEPDSE